MQLTFVKYSKTYYFFLFLRHISKTQYTIYNFHFYHILIVYLFIYLSNLISFKTLWLLRISYSIKTSSEIFHRNYMKYNNYWNYDAIALRDINVLKKNSFQAGKLLLIVSLKFLFEHKRNTLILLSWSFDNYI